MKTSYYFRESLPALKNLIALNGLHAGDGPVNLHTALEFLNINLRYYHKPRLEFFGFAAAMPGHIAKGPVIFINNAHSSAVQRKTLAHELIHILEHKYGQAHRSAGPDLQEYSVQEAEADCGAAYLLVPLGYLLEEISRQTPATQIAAELDVPVELVNLRFEIALELDELAGWELDNR